MTKDNTYQPSLWQRGRRYVLPLFLLFWLFCIPLAVSIYTPLSYSVNCYWNERCERMGSDLTDKSIDELTTFFRHQSNELRRPWTSKEFQHLAEVRGIYDAVFVIFAVITVIMLLDLLRNGRPERYHRHAFISLNILIGLFLSMLAISPFFNFFWMELFHPLVFSNQLWRTDPQDVSWYLMPKSFFLRVIVFILASTILLNLLLLWLLPTPKNRVRQESRLNKLLRNMRVPKISL